MAAIPASTASPATATAAATAIDADNPWPGLSAFDESSQRFFGGREAESAELLRLVGQAPLSVLFGKSGLGKTSLLKAGLIPRLRALHVLPVYLRLDVRDRSAPLIEQAAVQLAAEAARQGVDAPAPRAGESLWEHLHGRDAAWWSRLNQPQTPLFVFDQFEEVFTLGAEHAAGIERLRLDLADLIENRIPRALADRIDTGASVEHLDLRAQRYKVLLSFREDFLPEVEGWKGELPSLMRNRLRLLPMGSEQAWQVVSGQTAAGATHALVGDADARAIVRFVAAVQSADERGAAAPADPGWDTLAVEPALLSLVCAGLNDVRQARGQATIDAALLKETGAEIIGDFYRRCVADVPERTRRFIEDALITEGGFRNSYPVRDAIEQGALSEALLRRLVDRRLLRIDHQFGAERVELIHDRLTGVVREHRDRERERLRARRQRRLWWAAGSAGLALAVVGGVFFSLWRDAQAALREALVGKLVMQSRSMLDRQQRPHADQALLLAAAAYRLNPGTDAFNGLRQALDATPRLLKTGRFLGIVHWLSPDGATVVSASRFDGSVRVWDALTGQERGDGRVRHDGGVLDVAFSRDGKLFATASEDKTVRLWDSAGGRPRGEPLRGHAQRVTAVAFSADGRRLASASEDRTLRLWDAVTGQPQGGPLQGHDGTVWGVAFSADGRLLASGGADMTVRLWDAASGRPRGAPLQGHGGSVTFVAFSPTDANTLLSGDNMDSLRLWDVGSARLRGAPMRWHSRWRVGAAFSPDGRTLAALARGEGAVQLWDAASGAARGEPMRAHDGVVTSVAFSPDGRTLASGGQDNRIQLWDSANGQARGPAMWGHTSNGVDRLAFSRDGTVVVAATGDGLVNRWNAAGGADSATAPAAPLMGHVGRVAAVAFAPDGKTLASAGQDRMLRLWDAASGRPRGAPLQGHTDEVTALAFSPDGRTLLSGSRDGTLRRWEAASGLAQGPALQAHPGGVTSVAFSPDGTLFASAGLDGRARLWDAASAAPRGAALEGHDRAVSGVAFAPDGKTLATGGVDETLRLWTVATGRAQGEPLQGLTDDVTGLRFSPDGRTLASTSISSLEPTLWDATARAAMRVRPSGHTHVVTAIAFSPDGRTLASGSMDKTVRFWDPATGQPQGVPLRGHTDGVNALAFSPDGRWLVSAGVDGTLRRWEAPAHWIELVCAKLTYTWGGTQWKARVGNDVGYESPCPALPLPPR